MSSLGNESLGKLLTGADLNPAGIALPGNCTANTPAQFDNDTSLATTEFVQRALGNRSASVSYWAATTNLPAADAGKAIYLSGSASVVNLPALSAVGDGATFAIQCAVPVTINRNGADIIAANGGGQTSLSLTANSTVVITKSSAVNAWVVDGSARLLYDGNFTSYLAGSGYQKLPSGLIIQWGTTGSISAGGQLQVALPVAFTISNLSAVCMAQYSNAPNVGFMVSIYGRTLTSMSFYNSNTGTALSATWFAIGF